MLRFWFQFQRLIFSSELNLMRNGVYAYSQVSLSRDPLRPGPWRADDICNFVLLVDDSTFLLATKNADFDQQWSKPLSTPDDLAFDDIPKLSPNKRNWVCLSSAFYGHTSFHYRGTLFVSAACIQSNSKSKFPTFIWCRMCTDSCINVCFQTNASDFLQDSSIFRLSAQCTHFTLIPSPPRLSVAPKSPSVSVDVSQNYISPVLLSPADSYSDDGVAQRATD